MNALQIQFDNNSSAVRQDGDNVNLTDLWKLAGSPSEKKPTDWLESKAVQEFIDMTATMLNTGISGILKVQRGRGKGTSAHKLIALSYTKYLDPKLHVLVNQAFLERVEEEQNPELAIQRGTDRAVRTWRKQGKSDKWIESRMTGVATRKSFTSTLANHGVKNQGYRNCTNATYAPLYGGTTEVVRHKKHLPDGASVRDHMDDLELAAVNLAEKMAQRSIETNNLQGNAQCELACTKAARSVAKALMDDRNQTIIA